MKVWSVQVRERGYCVGLAIVLAKTAEDAVGFVVRLGTTMQKQYVVWTLDELRPQTRQAAGVVTYSQWNNNEL